MSSFVCESCDEQHKAWNHAEVDGKEYPELEGKLYCLDCIEYVELDIKEERKAYEHTKER